MKKNRWRWSLLVVVLLAAVGCWFGDRTLKKHGHPGLVTFAKQWWRNYPKNFAMHPPEIDITVDDAGMEELDAVVQRARELGVIEQEGNDYVKARFRVNMPDDGAGSGEFKGKLRIKGKMTDHVEGKKWSFRVVAKKDGGFLGMQRFSLQHPGTRNYLCDWFYHRLMKGEGIIALRYGFCKVRLNEEDLGVYAYEEHFGPELLENNGRLKGPIVRFDPSLFWLHRTQGLDGGMKVNDAYGAYQAASLDAFGSDDLATDGKQRGYFEDAIARVDAFRRGELKASEVFDADLVARHLAMIDLVGGHHSMDWSDVKFYFDPVTRKLEPISYESFSAFPTKELAGAYRFTGPFELADELHTAFLKDPVIFRAYVHHLERMSRKNYLDSAFAVLKGALDSASATLYGEFPYKELDRSIYYANQQAIHTLLDVPKGFHAYQQERSGDTLRITLVPVESLPMQVDSLLLPNGYRVAPIGNAIIPCRSRGHMGTPVDVRFVIGNISDSALAKGMELGYRVLGSSRHRLLKVFPFNYREEDVDMRAQASNMREFPFLSIDEERREVSFRPGVWVIEKDLVIPTGYVVNANTPLRLTLNNDARIISGSRLEWHGHEEAPIVVEGTRSGAITLMDAPGESYLGHVDFSSMSCYRSAALVRYFRTARVQVSRGVYKFTGGIFSGGKDQLKSAFAETSVSACTFRDAEEDALQVDAGTLALDAVTILHTKGAAIKANGAARVEGSCAVDSAAYGVDAGEGSRVRLERSVILHTTTAVHAGKEEMRYGPVKVDLKDVRIEQAGTEYKCGSESVITVDGKKVVDGKVPGTP